MLTTGDKKWIRGAIIEGVTDAINQVMIPYSEDQEKRLKEDFGDLRGDIAKLERKLDNVTDHQAEKLDDHDRRAGKLELAAA